MQTETPDTINEAACGASAVERVVMRWFREVKVGDMLNPKPLWNQTEREQNRLTVPTKVFGISNGSSESGVLFEVRTKSGASRILDSGWFEPHNFDITGAL